MGINVTALAQKARTQTLIVDSDLDMGQYDVIATDVKGGTAEFSEFVGGVGNFESGLISGGLDVSGILHAEGNTQVDGNLLLEGSINNVNITDDGEITTTKGVNGADFNGIPLKPNITVTPTSTFYPICAVNIDHSAITILPFTPYHTYSGSVVIKCSATNIITNNYSYRTRLNSTVTSGILKDSNTLNITLNNANCLYLYCRGADDWSISGLNFA